MTASDKGGLLSPENGLPESSAGATGRYQLRNADIREYINETFREYSSKCLDINTPSCDEKEFCLLAALFSILKKEAKCSSETTVHFSPDYTELYPIRQNFS
jgi:hypothetical protein